MLSKTHVLVALLLGLVIVKFVELVHPILFVLIFCIASLLPDIDHPGSILGKRLWPFSLVLQVLVGHRGILHSLFVPAGFVFLGYYTGYVWVGVAVAGGYVSHLAIDAFTFSGVSFLGPFSGRTKGFMRTGGVVEAGIFLGLLVALVWILGHLYL